jgi:peptidoglycan-associated lipoprotein
MHLTPVSPLAILNDFYEPLLVNYLRRIPMKNRRIFMLGVIVLLSLFALWGCPKKSQVTTTPEAAPAAKSEPTAEQKAEPMKEEAKLAVKDESMERAAPAASGLQSIYFDFDRSFVRDDAKATMKANAEWLKANPKVKVKIEGNCDERGTKEYNQALGQRRATSAKKYLTDMGISAKRISLISYGKEKPVCNDSTEGCWQKNRRGDLIAVTE